MVSYKPRFDPESAVESLFLRIRRSRVEQEQNWHAELSKIPFIQFPADWQIQITPAYSDAVIRFRVKLPSGTEKSIFMDSRCSLGCWYDKEDNPVPYWEVHTVDGAGEDAHCELADVKRLLELIADEGVPQPDETKKKKLKKA